MPIAYKTFMEKYNEICDSNEIREIDESKKLTFLNAVKNIVISNVNAKQMEMIGEIWGLNDNYSTDDLVKKINAKYSNY
jgi:uncharacterized protein YxjI